MLTLDQEPRGDSFSTILHPSLPPLHRPAPPLASLHFFTSETEEEKRLRLEMGFTTEADHDADADLNVADEDVDVDMAGPSNSKKQSRRTDSLVPVSREDSATPGAGASTTMLPPPRTSDLRIPPLGNDETIPHTRTIPPADPVIVDTIPQIEGTRRDGEDPLAPDPTFAPLHGASNDLYPEPIGPVRSGLKDQHKSFKEQEGHAETSQSSEGRSGRQIKAAEDFVRREEDGVEDGDEEPMPELDSDMDLSEEEGEGEGDEEEEEDE